ncbi:MAG: DUF1501 domain-containing protein [Pirellulaceae bacterium]
MIRRGLSRRKFLGGVAGLWGASSCGWLPRLAQAAAANGKPKRHCIVLWMAGGPSQLDTFDLKPGHANGGEFKEIETSVPGVRISEHLPQLAERIDHLAILRGMHTKEGDHQRGTYLMHTGQTPGGPLSYPSLGSVFSQQLGADDAVLPNFISINPELALGADGLGSGFLGPKYAPVQVVDRGAAASPGNPETPDAPNEPRLGIDFLNQADGVTDEQVERRLAMWRARQAAHAARRGGEAATAHDTIFNQAVRMMRGEAASAFDLEQESDETREAYGRGTFGQGCLVARRLVERGVPFVEVTLRGQGLGWDTHLDNFSLVRDLSSELDKAWSQLLDDLKERGLLESTTIVWMGEFGRTPVINASAGRDHFPDAWSCVLGGGGIRGGQAYGTTNDSGMEVVEGKVEVQDLWSTLCQAVGIDPETEIHTPLGRPLKLAEGFPVHAVLS